MHSAKPFPIPIVAFGPGTQIEDDTLDYLVMPQGMQTYRPPQLPEPEVIGARPAALAVLQQVCDTLAQVCDGQLPSARVSLGGLGAKDLELINSVLGEGEVSAQVLPAGDGWAVRAQESVFAGVWRVVERRADGAIVDAVEIGAAPAALAQAAALDAAGPAPAPAERPQDAWNAPSILVELEEQRRSWKAGALAHVVNLTLLPLSPGDAQWLEHELGRGRVLILSRGYGNCRVQSTARARTWRVSYFNSADSVILDSIEVCALPEVALAAAEDLADSRTRLEEVLAWVQPT